MRTFDDAEVEDRHTVQYFSKTSQVVVPSTKTARGRLDKAPPDLSPETMRWFAPGTYDPDQGTFGGAVLPTR